VPLSPQAFALMSVTDCQQGNTIMTRIELLSKLTEIFRDIFEDPDLNLTPETTADMIPQWDSMSQVTLAVEIEHRFNIRLKSAEMEQMRSVSDLMALIEARLKVAVR
jgi:acyl carrier protein